MVCSLLRHKNTKPKLKFMKSSTRDTAFLTLKHPIQRDRFKAMHSHLRFDDKYTRVAKRRESLFAPLKEVHDFIAARMRRYYTPGPFITIDEQLVGFRGRCAFRQYMASKPDKRWFEATVRPAHNGQIVSQVKSTVRSR